MKRSGMKNVKINVKENLNYNKVNFLDKELFYLFNSVYFVINCKIQKVVIINCYISD